jgi:acetylornithine deacetylase/succinyl-diaminopimelate desuccinylase-like protein
MTPMRGIAIVLCGVLLQTPVPASAQDDPARRLARDIFEELIEINTVTASGDTLRAAEAMAARLTSAGFADADVQVLSPAPRKGNLVARLRGTGARRPLLLLAHLDVVEARREDWSLDPFTFTEQDGYYYGRGTTDDKNLIAAWVTVLIGLKQEGFTPDRDIVLVLETDEETADRDELGMRWLLANHRDLLDAEFALNEGGNLLARDGRPLSNSVQTSEKRYSTFRLEVRNPGGHSSVPAQDNAIYRLAAGLGRIAGHRFPVALNETTRAWLEKSAGLEPPEIARAMREVAGGDPEPAAVERLSSRPTYNAQLRTTCVATMLGAGHAENALPQLATATVNCRILPGGSPAEVQQVLERVLADEAIAVTPTETDVDSPPSPLNDELFTAIADLSEEFWPGVPVVPTMGAGATDSRFLRNAGIPSYGHTGFQVDVDDVRAHGRDERIGVEAFHAGVEYLSRLVRRLASPR